jgi:hypothetical protein
VVASDSTGLATELRLTDQTIKKQFLLATFRFGSLLSFEMVKDYPLFIIAVQSISSHCEQTIRNMNSLYS